jgi:hypothetical protein
MKLTCHIALLVRYVHILWRLCESWFWFISSPTIVANSKIIQPSSKKSFGIRCQEAPAEPHLFSLQLVQNTFSVGKCSGQTQYQIRVTPYGIKHYHPNLGADLNSLRFVQCSYRIQRRISTRIRLKASMMGIHGTAWTISFLWLVSSIWRFWKYK